MNTTGWEQQIKALRQRLGYPEGRDDGEIERMLDKFEEEASEFTFAADPPVLPDAEIASEAGDVLVMLTAILAAHGFTIADALQAALDKLTRRAEERGDKSGEG